MASGKDGSPGVTWSLVQGYSLLLGINEAWAASFGSPSTSLTRAAAAAATSITNASSSPSSNPADKASTHPAQAIAAFDFDDTLVRVAGGHVFPKSGGDWRLAFASIPAKLAKLAPTHRIVILSNQKGTDANVRRRDIFTQRVQHFLRTLDPGVPVAVLAAIKDGGAWC
jgi:hypothetical protein